MAIGIVDLDYLILKRRRQYQLNMDIMQLAAYYRKNGDRIKYCYSLKQEELQWYTTLYVIYNGEEEVFIDYLFKDPRVIFVGRYFYGEYCSLSQEIKDSYPDKSFYEDILNKANFTDKKKSILRDMLKKTDFIRLHEASNKKFLTSNSDVVIFDQNITDSDYNEIMNLGKRFSLYYPIKLRTYAQAEKWMEAKAFNRSTGTRNFIADNFPERDIYQILKLPNHKRRMFILKFGDCSPELYNFELKKCLRVIHKAKFIKPNIIIKVVPILDRTYDLLFTQAIKWYNSRKAELENTNIFINFFKDKNRYELLKKIKAKDPELYELMSFTLLRGVLDERANRNYRRVD